MDRERKKRLALWKAMSEGLRIIEEDELEAEKNRPAARTRAYQNALGEQAQTPLGGVFIEIALSVGRPTYQKESSVSQNRTESDGGTLGAFSWHKVAKSLVSLFDDEAAESNADS